MVHIDLVKKTVKKVGVAVLFIGVLLLTYIKVFSNNDISLIMREIRNLDKKFLALILISAFLYTGIEGTKIWMMMDGTNDMGAFLRCISYAFIEFFYSGITPSASGGQPIQLLYMKKDGYSFTKGCASMSLIALLNKFVLAFMGFVLVIFWHEPLEESFGSYIGWFYAGWGMVVAWTVILNLIIFSPDICERFVLWTSKLPLKLGIIKHKEKVHQEIKHFFDAYRGIVNLVRENRRKVILIGAVSFLQRFCLVIITYWVYRGLNLYGTGFVYIACVQLAIMITVDMIPLPGAQGISEYIYHRVYSLIFGGQFLATSMVISRGANFYFLLLIGGMVIVLRKFFVGHREYNLRSVSKEYCR